MFLEVLRYVNLSIRSTNFYPLREMIEIKAKHIISYCEVQKKNLLINPRRERFLLLSQSQSQMRGSQITLTSKEL